jgi:diguanylate cyclase (GGDEF)-like protein/PAS domain S-box-containing protein
MSEAQGAAPDPRIGDLTRQLSEAMAAATDAYRQSARLIRVLTVLGQSSSSTELIDQTLVVLSQTFNADVVAIVRAAGGRLEVVGACGLAESDRSFVEGWPLIGSAAEAIRTRAPVVRSGILPDQDVPEPLRQLALRSAVWVPMDHGEEKSGELLVLYRRSATGFDRTDLHVLESVTVRVQMALAVRERSATVEQLALSAHRLAGKLDLQSVLEEAIKLLPDLLNVDGAAVVTVEDGVANLRAQGGGMASEKTWPLPVSDLLGWAEAQRDEVRVSTGEVHGRPGHFLTVPVRRDDQPVAVLYLFRSGHRPFLDEAIESARLFANYLGSAMANARLYEALGKSEGSLRLITDSISDLVAVVDSAGQIGYASPSHERELARPVDALVGTDLRDLVNPDDQERFDAWLADPGDDRIEYRLLSGDGHWVWVESALRPAPSAQGALVLSSRVIDERRRLEEELRRRATHDPLTELANRDLAQQWLEEMLARDEPGLVGVLFCDLDRFKEVNDRLGHEAGDELLVDVTDRLRTCVRQGDLLARFGGDEFLVLLDEAADMTTLREVGNRLVTALEAPFPLRGERVLISASVGGVLGRRRVATSTALLRDADAAMYAAKDAGRARVVVFDDDASHRSRERLELMSHLSHALGRGELLLHYQPIVNLATARIVGFEALARWCHPTRGFVPPDVFIPLAEESGTIVEIGDWVLGEASRQLAAWRKQVNCRIRMNVNLSPNQVRHRDSAERSLAIIREAGARPEDIWLEVTEHASTRTDVAEFAAAMRAAGAHLSLDDFGISYSNLSNLELLPVEELKIDKSFVQGLIYKDTDRGIVRAVLAIADSLGLSVVAEGIETTEQREALLELGCRIGQGYLFARPMPAEGATGLLGLMER